MSFHYRVVEKQNALPNAKRATYAYASAKQIGRVGIKELAEDIADRTTLHRSDVRAVLDCLSISSMSMINKGLGVDLGELGSFSIRLKSKATEKKEDFLPSNIRSAQIRYTPSVEIKDKLKKLSLVNLATITEVKPSQPASPEEGGTEGGNGEPGTDPGTGGTPEE